MPSTRPHLGLRAASASQRLCQHPVQAHAFTLVEVLVVVVIVGIAAGIVVPQMMTAGSLTLQAAGRMIIADLLYAQNDAVVQMRHRKVVFDVDHNRYGLTDGDDNPISVNWRTGGSTLGNYSVDFASDTRFRGVRITAADFGGSAQLEYDELGTPVSGGYIEIQGANFKYRIIVTPMTGRVTISEVSGV
jgi:prepilin-type N-terminal cleavage/methylation domain-containing protein